MTLSSAFTDIGTAWRLSMAQSAIQEMIECGFIHDLREAL